MRAQSITQCDHASFCSLHALPTLWCSKLSALLNRCTRRCLLCGTHRWSVWTRNYSRVLYMDTDTLVTRPLDELWNTEFRLGQVAAAVPAIGPSHFGGHLGMLTPTKCSPSTQFNSAVILLRPSPDVESALMRALTQGLRTPIDCKNEQQAFNRFFGGVHTRCLGHTYNCYDPTYLVAGTDDATVKHDKMLLGGDRATAESVRDAERTLLASLQIRSGSDPSSTLWTQAANSHGYVSNASCPTRRCALQRDASGRRSKCVETEQARAGHEQSVPSRLHAIGCNLSAMRWHEPPTPRTTPRVIHFIADSKPWRCEHMACRMPTALPYQT